MRSKTEPGKVNRCKHEIGQAMVEFMLVIVFLFILFVCILQMILLMHAYNTLADAAKEGIRYAIVHGTQNSICSGPGDSTVSPVITCSDPMGQNVIDTVANFAGVSFQNISNTPNVEVSVSWNPQDTNGTCANGPCANLGCSAPGCMVRVTVSHTYTPLFGLNWPSFALNAAANGRIMN
jgi:Flp pilus assembly protein TadG